MPIQTTISLTVSDGAVGTEKYTVENVQLESYHAEPEMADDAMTPKGSRFNIVASGLLPVEAWVSVQAALSRTGNRADMVEMEHPSVPNDFLVYFNATGSDIGGPFVKMTGTQVIGSTVVLVRMEITDRIAVCDSPVTSHVWTQRMSTDASGQITRTVQGTMSISRASTGVTVAPPARGSSPWTATIPWGDIFRRAIIPALPAYGWRRESQDFAYDAHSTALIYTVVDRQHAHDLPDGVRVGDMEFSYERSLDNPAVANCSFSCDLQGEISMRNLDYGNTTRGNRILVDAAVQLSKTRINATYGNMLITRMRVTEKNMLSAYAIRFELDAQAYPNKASPDPNDPTTQVVSPLAYMIGQGFKVTRSTSRELDAYGARVRNLVNGDPSQQSELFVLVPHYLGNAVNGMDCLGTDAGLPYAVVYTITQADPTYGAVSVTVLGGNVGLGPSNDTIAGKYIASMAQATASSGYTNIVAHNLSVTNVRSSSGIVRLSAMYSSAADLVFQTKKPEVRVTERVEVSKVNTAPARINRPLPTGAYIVAEDWNVSFGRFDAQGNRVFTGVFERTYALYDIGGIPVGPAGTPTANGYYEFTGSAGPLNGDKVRGWKAPNGTVAATISPLATTASQVTAASVFANTADNIDARYAVASENPAT